jgi:hypothetical protein
MHGNGLVVVWLNSSFVAECSQRMHGNGLVVAWLNSSSYNVGTFVSTT